MVGEAVEDVRLESGYALEAMPVIGVGGCQEVLVAAGVGGVESLLGEGDVALFALEKQLVALEVFGKDFVVFIGDLGRVEIIGRLGVVPKRRDEEALRIRMRSEVPGEVSAGFPDRVESVDEGLRGHALVGGAGLAEPVMGV